MTMTEYFPIYPLGEGTLEIEALGSLLCRMAKMHAVSVYTLSNHLRNWWHHRVPGNIRVGNTAANMLCGSGSCVDAFVAVLSEATGCLSVDRTTFVALRPVITWYGPAVARAGRAWCPACLEEATDRHATFYDRLIWSIPSIKRCSIHRVALDSSCPHCGAGQSYYHHLGQMDLCFKCKQSLRRPSADWEAMLDPVLCERECEQLVQAISSGTLSPVVPDAYNIFLGYISNEVSKIHKKYDRKDTLSDILKSITAKPGHHPRLQTLLRRCALLGVSPVDLVRDPVETARSINLLDFSPLNLPADVRPRQPEYLIDLANAKLREGLRNTNYDLLMPLGGIANCLGVSKGFLNYRLGALCAEYARHRQKCAKLKSKEKIREAIEFLLSGPILSYPSSEYPSHDHLVAAAVDATKIGVRLARLAVNAALRKKHNSFDHH